MLVDRARDADAARRRKGLEPRSDVHAVPEQVVGLDHHVPDMDANAEFDPAVCRKALVRLSEPLLCLHRALNGIHGARELREHAVARGVGDPAAVLRDEAVQDLPARREQAKCPDLVRAHQARIAGHVRREDRGELALHSLVWCGRHRQCLSTSPRPWWSARLHSVAGLGSRKGTSARADHDAFLLAPVSNSAGHGRQGNAAECSRHEHHAPPAGSAPAGAWRARRQGTRMAPSPRAAAAACQAPPWHAAVSFRRPLAAGAGPGEPASYSRRKCLDSARPWRWYDEPMPAPYRRSGRAIRRS